MKDTMVVASGGFDPLHVGHIEYLEAAKRLGTHLIVVVNTDEFLIKKKGFAFMKENERLRIIKSLKCVDFAIISIDEDMSVCKTLKMLKPDIFAKGGDRNISNIPEVEICQKIGCMIVDGLGEKIQSSSDLVKRISNK